MFKQEFLFLGQSPVCKTISPSSRRRSSVLRNNDNSIPSYDPYIPRTNTIIYNCSSLECRKIVLHSLTQVIDPDLNLKSCFLETDDKYDCETVRYNHLKNVDKLLFLSDNIKNKTFYTVDCLVYADSGRVCHKKDDHNSHTKLVDTGTIVRPNETNILSQDEFVCEENNDGHVNCDINPFVSYNNILRLKRAINTDEKVLLKTGHYVVPLQKNCIEKWCGYSGIIVKSARRQYRYDPPGGKVYRCYYAKKQQICKELYGTFKPMYNERDWLNT